MKRFKKTIYMCATLMLGALTSSCLDDVLDRKPLDQIGPDNFYTTANQLQFFTINQYYVFGNSAGSWSAGQATWDDGTDNQASPEPNRVMFYKPEWKVSSTGELDFGAIRNLNWFITNVEGKVKVGGISGDPKVIEQALGEAYFLRAYHYFSKLQQYGDYFIITEVLPDVEEVLIEKAKRMPRNEVARFIMKDLDVAIEKLPETTLKKQRLTKDVAHLFRSRVALFEATWEMYHRGSGRVPGDDKWPGKDKEWNKGKNFDIDGEINFFLTEAMNSSKLVADKVTLAQSNGVFNPSPGSVNGWNPLYDLFASVDPSGFSEVLLWRQYSADAGLVHHTTNRLTGGSGTGWTRGLVESFLDTEGRPKYDPAFNSRSDETIKKVKEGRDHRLQLFIYAEEDEVIVGSSGEKFNIANFLASNASERDVTGYRQRKFKNYDPNMLAVGQIDQTATLIFRGAEAMLNYIEASYLKEKSLNGDATKYWNALRQRAGITAPLQATIDATDMSKEADLNRPSYDWAAFSAGQPLTDATLYSIRRERRCEFAGEGMRMFDLKRWRAMDQVKNYQIEGVNFWDRIHTYPEFTDKESGNSLIVADEGDKANVSSNAITKYFRPYQIRKNNNDLYDGYTFTQGHYLSPFSVEELQLCAPNLYQNPGWKTEANTEAED